MLKNTMLNCESVFMSALDLFKPCGILCLSVTLHCFLQECVLIAVAQYFEEAKHDIPLKNIPLTCQSPLHFLGSVFSSHPSNATFYVRCTIKSSFSSHRNHCQHSDSRHVGMKGVTICEAEDHQAN